MKIKRFFAAFLLCTIAFNIAGSSAFAAGEPNIKLNTHYTRSYNSSFTLNFSESTAWTLDFDNNAFAMLNHRYVNVEYTSCTPDRYTNAKVHVQLYIDDDEDDVYEPYDPNGGYSYQVKVGETLKITLPHGNTVKNYRLRFVNQTSAVTSGVFTVETTRN